MNRRRDIILIGLALLAQTLFDFLVLIGTGRWNIPWQQKFAIAAVMVLVIVIFMLAVRNLYRAIGIMDAEAEAQRQKSTDTRERNLIDAINKAAGERDQELAASLNTLNQTLQSIQEQNKQQHRQVTAALGQLEQKGHDEEY